MVKLKFKMRDMSFWKPAKFKDYLTINELSQKVDRDISWLRVLERDGRIPLAARVKRGQLEIRLWSPTQVKEIEEILSNMKVGRPKKDG